MLIVHDKNCLGTISNLAIRHRIAGEIERLEQQFAEAYSPSLHGWFAVVENEQDFYAPLLGLRFSCSDRIQDQLIEWVGKEQDHFEVLFTINDNEAIMVYIPDSLLTSQPSLYQPLLHHIQTHPIT